ncbi:MAG: tetratricopeptide repeat protein, partial [Planctomycetota bacterium]
ELGYDPAGRPYIAMKRVHGRTLQAEIHDSHRRRLSDADLLAHERHLLDVFIKVCDAVGYAHSRRVIHRDLKPDNVMVGEFGEVLVMDWGLARPIDGGDMLPATLPAPSSSGRMVRSSRRDDESAELTIEGDVFGTPAYMAPEQAEGRVADFGPHTDIYALGGILYAILTGEAPFGGANKPAIAIMNDVRLGRLIPPSERKTSRRVPRELEAAVLRAMAQKPRDRYETAADLADDIRSYLSGRAVSAADYTSWQLIWKWTRRHKVAVAGGISTAAAIIIGLLAVIVSRAEARQQELDKQVVRADEFVAAARQELESARLVPFNPASPQDYYTAWLPPLLKLGRAIQTHPSPPDEWRTELAGYSLDLQHHAADIGDWGMALHVAQSAAAWGAVSEAAAADLVQQVQNQREQRAVEDRNRLQLVLRRIHELETPPEQEFFNGHDPRRYTLHEFDERAMRLAGAARSDSVTLASSVISLLQGDAETCRRFGIDGPPDWLQRHFLINLAGRLRDGATAVNGMTLVDLAVAELRREPLAPERAEEAGWWIEAAVRMDSAVGKPVSAALGRPLRDHVQARFEQDRHIGERFGISACHALLEANSGVIVELDKTNLHERDLQLACLGDWLVASARSGSDFTAALLDVATSRDTPVARHFALDMLGRWGDALPPDINRPERSAPTVLSRVLGAVPRDALMSSPGATDPDSRIAVACIGSISRLGAGDCWNQVFDLLASSKRGSGLYRRCGGAGMLMPMPDRVANAPASALGVEGLLRRSLAHSMSGNFQQSIADTTAAIELDPTDPRPWGNRAILRTHLEQPGAGMPDINEALKLDPRNAEWWMTRAALHEQAGSLQAALDDYDRAMPVAGPHSLPGVIENRARIIHMMGDTPGGIAGLDRAIELDPLSPDFYFNRGLLRMNTGAMTGALEDFKTVCDLDVSYARAWTVLAQLMVTNGDPAGGRIHASMAIAADPTAAGGWTVRGMAHEGLRMADAALADYAHAISLDPKLSVPLNNRGALYLNLGRVELAFADFTRVTEVAPGNWRGWCNRGVAAARLGARDVAVDSFRRALEVCPPAARGSVEQFRRRELGN